MKQIMKLLSKKSNSCGVQSPVRQTEIVLRYFLPWLNPTRISIIRFCPRTRSRRSNITWKAGDWIGESWSITLDRAVASRRF